jgi:hypothetical protein
MGEGSRGLLLLIMGVVFVFELWGRAMQSDCGAG